MAPRFLLLNTQMNLHPKVFQIRSDPLIAPLPLTKISVHTQHLISASSRPDSLSTFMASTIVSFSSFAGARPKTRNPSKKSSSHRNPSPKPSPKPKSKSNLKTLIGSEATTYTRLPPRDSTDDRFSPSISTIIKLHESPVPAQNLAKDPVFEEEDEESGLEWEDEDEVILGLGSDSDDEASDLEEFDDEIEEGELGEVKEKGVPAIMRCFDRAKIYVKAGNGGNGVVAFRREKYVPYGGPSGGDGGKGGDVYVEVDGSMNSLLPFRKNVHFRALRGAHGQGRKQAGAKGEDVVVKVAPGTVVRDARTGEVLLELMNAGERGLLLPGGRGGRGNASFKSGMNKVPKIAENGEEGAEMWLDLELKLVADVGIVGAPNAGKSTLLSAISAAEPSIANYPFTTLLPNLGVVSLDFDATMVVADLPGLLEGAHRGFGLGHEFLRHTERCSVLVHVVDGSAIQPEYEFDAVRLELELFSPGLAEKPFIVAYNKMDLPEAYEKWVSFKEHLETRDIHPFCISAINRQGTHDIVCAAYELLQKELEKKKNTQEGTGEANLNHVADSIQKQRSASMNDFEVFHDSDSNTWHVVGAGIQRFVQMTNWQYAESLRRFQHALEACGVNKSLAKHGVKEGDTVIIADMEMIWNNATEQFGPTRRRKTDI